MSDEPKRILVAEDNPGISRVISFNLEKKGHDVTVARDGREAWEYVQINHFDMIITDQQMPYLTGCQLCQRVRELETYAEVPILLLTAKQMELDTEQLKAEGLITAAFPKPFSPNRIVQVVQQLLAGVPG